MNDSSVTGIPTFIAYGKIEEEKVYYNSAFLHFDYILLARDTNTHFIVYYYSTWPFLRLSCASHR